MFFVDCLVPCIYCPSFILMCLPWSTTFIRFSSCVVVKYFRSFKLIGKRKKKKVFKVSLIVFEWFFYMHPIVIVLLLAILSNIILSLSKQYIQVSFFYIYILILFVKLNIWFVSYTWCMCQFCFISMLLLVVVAGLILF